MLCLPGAAHLLPSCGGRVAYQTPGVDRAAWLSVPRTSVLQGLRLHSVHEGPQPP